MIHIPTQKAEHFFSFENVQHANVTTDHTINHAVHHIVLDRFDGQIKLKGLDGTVVIIRSN